MSDFEKILFGNENRTFIPEIIIRTLIMYIMILVSLRLLGKKGGKQLSIFELVVIISWVRQQAILCFIRKLA